MTERDRRATESRLRDWLATEIGASGRRRGASIHAAANENVWRRSRALLARIGRGVPPSIASPLATDAHSAGGTG